MARPSAPVKLAHPLPEYPMSSNHKEMTSTLEITQQLARVDLLHSQLKAETLRAQEFLLKLRRDEVDAVNQTQSKINGRTAHLEATVKQNKDLHNEHRDEFHSEKKETSKTASAKPSHDGIHTVNHEAGGGTGGGEEMQNEASCKCQCSHHPWSPTQEAVLRKAAEKYKSSLNLHRHVDEREVRDLEKRVRGLEGRVRGFEGLPPDREIALLEVERLRRELEGLARRREGLFEGLNAEWMENVSGKMAGMNAKGTGKSLVNGQGNGEVNATGKSVGTGKK